MKTRNPDLFHIDSYEKAFKNKCIRKSPILNIKLKKYKHTYYGGGGQIK